MRTAFTDLKGGDHISWETFTFHCHGNELKEGFDITFHQGLFCLSKIFMSNCQLTYD